MNREEYLNKIWTPYPRSPDDCQVRGRLQKIEKLTKQENSFDAKCFVALDIESNFVTTRIQVSSTEVTDILQAGDWVAVHNSQVSLLSPKLALSPFSQKRDQELFAVIPQWNLFLFKLRNFFLSRQFLEVSTPSLVDCPGTEPTLEVFSTEFHQGSRCRTLFLPKSPEIHLKKCLHRGFEKIFEVARSYRNNELTSKHQPEFWILEWYRAFQSLDHIQQDVMDLIDTLAKELNGGVGPSRYVKKTVAQLFLEVFEFVLRPETTEMELRQLALTKKIDVHAASSIDDVFFLLFFEIEKSMDPGEVLFVCEYPPYQAALARVNAQGWAARFEVYWQGMELANAFHELNDPRLQRQRSLEDVKKKELAGQGSIPFDEEFFVALEAGMPPSSGIALGLERLFMALFSYSDIRDIRLFPIRDGATLKRLVNLIHS